MARPDLARETPLAALLQRVTPNDAFFVRSHAPATPHVDRAAYRLHVVAPRATRALTLDDLRALPRVAETITLACSGNGRTGFDPVPGGLPWGFGAIATARWDGVRLRDVLASNGAIPDDMRHVVLDALDAAPDAQRPPFRRSIPIARALHDGTLVADAMNGEPIPDEHGGPVRLIVGGWTGNHAVKWLRRITLSREPDRGHWMTNDYRIPGDGGAMTMIESFAPCAVIASPLDGARVADTLRSAGAAQAIDVEGIAYGEPAPAHVRIEVDGAHAGDAAVRYDDGPLACGRWSLRVDLAPGEHRVAARAADADGAPFATTPWNAGGYLYNGAHAITITAP